MKAATIKTIIILIVLILAIILPIGDAQSFEITIISSAITLGLVLFGIIILPDGSLYNNLKIRMVKWSDKIQTQNPPTYIQVTGYVLLASGLGGLVGGFLKGQTFNFVGSLLFVAGLGTLAGMYLLISINKKKRV